MSNVDVAALTGDFSVFQSALKSYLNGEPNSERNLVIATQNLVLTIGDITNNNPILGPAFNAIGLPGSLAAFNADLQKYNDATDGQTKNSALFGMTADGTGALAKAGTILAGYAYDEDRLINACARAQ